MAKTLDEGGRFYRPIRFGLLQTLLSAAVAAVCGLHLWSVGWLHPLEAFPTWTSVVWVLGIIAGGYSLALLLFEIYQALWGPTLALRFDPTNQRVYASDDSRMDGVRGFACAVRLRGWRRRAPIYRDGQKTPMRFVVTTFEPENHAIGGCWYDGHEQHSRLFIPLGTLLRALNGALHAQEVQILMSNSEPLAGVLMTFLTDHVIRYRARVEKAEQEIGLLQEVVAGANANEDAAMAEAESLRRRLEAWMGTRDEDELEIATAAPAMPAPRVLVDREFNVREDVADDDQVVLFEPPPEAPKPSVGESVGDAVSKGMAGARRVIRSGGDLVASAGRRAGDLTERMRSGREDDGGGDVSDGAPAETADQAPDDEQPGPSASSR